MLQKIKARVRPRRRMVLLIAIILALLIIQFTMRIMTAIALQRQTNNTLIPFVNVVKPKRAPLIQTIVLPGTVWAWHEAPIFARTNGYIKNWYVDIGSRVEKGQLLATIETPELDAQLRQAEADLVAAIAENKLAQTTAARWLNLRKTDAVSIQATEEKVDTAAAQEANVTSQRANRDRLRELVSFERVIAPFKGVISDRRTDIGALINIGSPPNEQQPLFRIAQLDPLRVYVKIPQRYSSRMKPNMVIQLRFAEHPGKLFAARLLETAHAIDPNTRTLLAQFIVKNTTCELLPGSYTSVSLLMPSLPNAVQLPINTLLFQRKGLQVATVDKHNRIVLKNVSIERDFGNTVEIASGISPDEQVVLNPSDAIYYGQQVRIARL